MNGRFVESLYSNGAFQGFHYREVLCERRTPFQKLAIYDTEWLGRVLVLDDIIQTTEADEFIYHEMLAHVPLMSLDRPRRVLIVGGGDGGTLREVLKHPVEHVDLVEIDQVVIDTAREYLPFLNDGGRCFDDERVTLVVRDAFEYLAEGSHRYDAILVDSTDPIGAAEALYSDRFYQLCEQSLSPDGVLAAQDGVVFFQRTEAAATVAALRRRGLAAGAYIAAVPMYYGGEMTFGFAARDAAVLTPQADRLERRFVRVDGELRHYSPAVHAASFVLPRWIAEAVEGKTP